MTPQELRASLREWLGTDGVAAVMHIIGVVAATPTVTISAARTEFGTWAAASGNAVAFDPLVSQIGARFNLTWAQFKALVLTRSPKGWSDERFMTIYEDEIGETPLGRLPVRRFWRDVDGARKKQSVTWSVVNGALAPSYGPEEAA